MRTYPVLAVVLATLLSACGRDGGDSTEHRASIKPGPTEPTPPTQPTNPEQPPLQRVVPYPYKSCNTNSDCTLVPSGLVCGDWSYDAISTDHAPGHCDRWRTDAASCKDAKSAALMALTSTPREYEARCPDKYSHCIAVGFTNNSCHRFDMTGSGQASLPQGGGFLLRSEREGRYKVTVSGQIARPRMLKLRTSDCASSEIATTDCYRASSRCIGAFWFGENERHTIEVEGCNDGCTVDVEYIGLRPIP
jgi:hypothetical protein